MRCISGVCRSGEHIEKKGKPIESIPHVPPEVVEIGDREAYDISMPASLLASNIAAKRGPSSVTTAKPKRTTKTKRRLVIDRKHTKPKKGFSVAQNMKGAHSKHLKKGGTEN